MTKTSNNITCFLLLENKTTLFIANLLYDFTDLL